MPFVESMKDVTYRSALWFFNARSRLLAGGSRTLKALTHGVGPTPLPSPGPSRPILTTLFLYSPYQRPYLLHLAESIKAVGDVEVKTYDMQKEQGPLKRKVNEFKDHGIGFHSYPFHTRQFPSTLHHVLVKHGFDSGKYDGLGSFSFGAGRTLDKNRRRLYDFILVSSPWSQALAHSEVPEYRDRVLVCGDWRADAIITLSNDTAHQRAQLNIPDGAQVVGIGSTHGRHSTFHRFGDQVFDVIAAGGDDTVFLIFFHEYERAQKKHLYAALREYCSKHANVRIVGNDQLESAIAACDLLISDGGSTSLYYSLLGRPLAYLPLDTASMLPDYPTLTLYPHVHNAHSLRDSASLVRQLRSSNSGLLSPPDWFIQRLYPRDCNFADLSTQALRTVLSTI